MTFKRKLAVVTFALAVATLALAQDSLSLLSGAWRMTSLESGTEAGNLQKVPYSGQKQGGPFLSTVARPHNQGQ